MAHGIAIPKRVAAMSVDAYNRSAKSASADLDNGNVVVLNTGVSSTAGEGEVWLATRPATATLAAGLFMVMTPEVVVTNSQFRNIDPDPRNFYVAQGKVFDAVKLQIGDIVELSEDCLAGTKSTNVYVVAADASYKLTWNATAVSGLSLKLVVDPSYISVPDGSISSGRVTSYIFEVVALA